MPGITTVFVYRFSPGRKLLLRMGILLFHAVGGIHLAFFLNRFVNFLAMNRDIPGAVNSEANLVSSNLDHHHADGIPDDDFFVFLTAENKHGQSLVEVSEC